MEETLALVQLPSSWISMMNQLLISYSSLPSPKLQWTNDAADEIDALAIEFDGGTDH
jgi:hypothetical protein